MPYYEEVLLRQFGELTAEETGKRPLLDVGAGTGNLA